MIVKTTWKGKRAFTAVGDSGYPIEMDATEAYGGDGKGTTPMELVLAGLAGCIGIDVTMILSRHMEAVREIEIEADGARKEEMPKGFTSIGLTFRINGDVTAARVWKAIDMGSKKYCAVSDSLKADIGYKVVLNGEDVPREP